MTCEPLRAVVLGAPLGLSLSFLLLMSKNGGLKPLQEWTGPTSNGSPAWLTFRAGLDLV